MMIGVGEGEGEGEDTTSKEELWEMSWSWGYFAVFDQDGESSMDVMSCHDGYCGVRITRS